MFTDTRATSSFAVGDIGKARDFYGETLGVKVSMIDEASGLMVLHLAGDRDTFVYQKSDHRPADYTILSFEVDDVEAAVDGLVSRGVTFERYEGFEQDDKGIAHGPGPHIAWFQDPAGNILAVLQQP